VSFILSQAKRFAILLVGVTILLLGIIMLVAPGPGIFTIALGLPILASEFVWARRLLARFRREGGSIRDVISRRSGRRTSKL
jgi:uncharacterized protein (TIGR02611 family)